MKILMVQRFDLTTVSCARRILAMAGQLAARGHSVTLVDFPHPDRQKELPRLHGQLPQGIHYLILDRRGTALLSNRTAVLEAARQTDLIHLWKCYPDAAVPALWAAYRLGLPVHYDWDDWETGISWELTGSRWVRSTVSLWEQTLPQLVETVTTASTALREKALKIGVTADRLFEAPVGADLEEFYPARAEPADKPVLIYSGQLEVASFARLAVEAFARLAPEYPSARLIIAGGGRQEEKIRQLVQQLNLDSQVEITGYLPADQIPQLLRKATIALAPFDENEITQCKSPLKIVEYLASGLPVVGSHVGEVPRMLEGCGVCVPAADSQAIAEAVRQLLQNTEQRKEMRQKSRLQAEQIYNWPRTVDNLERAYRKALQLKEKYIYR
jgi:glycosyltransferase involved in cell wall biosynthesis